jgi:hypothetical protein
MKRILTAALVAMFSLAIVGCRAAAEVDTDADNGRDSSYKKTTTVDRDGDRTVKTEKSTNR